MYGDFPAKNTVNTPYIPINVWFWPTLRVWHAHEPCLSTLCACSCLQLTNHPMIRPKSIHNPDILEEFSKEYLYLECVRFVKLVGICTG